MGTTIKQDEIWWLAYGNSSHSRQPSFAPPTARAVVTLSYYAFGWNKNKSCFISSRRHDVLSSADIKYYPCDRSVALGLLWQCARQEVCNRFFDGRYFQQNDA